MENTHGNTRSVVAGEVKALMGRHSVSKAELGKILGLTYPPLKKRLDGNQSFTVDELDRIADHFDVPSIAARRTRRG